MAKQKGSVDKSKSHKKGIPVHKTEAESHQDKINWKFFYMLLSSIVVIVFAAHLSGLWGGLVFNDLETLKFLSTVQDSHTFWSGLWTQAFKTPLTQQYLKATYAWDYEAAGFSVVWHHIVNLGLHLVASGYLFILVFTMSWRLKHQGRLDVDPYMLAFASAAIFACHPFTSEAVGYISGRVAPLMAANYFLALNCFLLSQLAKSRALRIWGYIFSAIFVVNAILVSNEALLLPLTMIMIALIIKQPGIKWTEWATRKVWVLCTLIVLAGTLPYLALLGVSVPSGNGNGLQLLPAVSYYATQLKAVVTYYLRGFLIPIGLTVDPPCVLANDFADPLAILGGVVLLGAIFCIWFFRSRPMISFGFYLFIAGLVPSIALLQPEYVADRRIYLSLAGLSILAGWALAKLAMTNWQKTLIVTASALLVLIGLTMWRNYSWSSNEALWQSAIAANANSGRAHAMYALSLIQNGKTEKAVMESKQALQLSPGTVPATLAVAATLLNSKDYQGASEQFAHAVELAQKQKLSPEIVGTAASGAAESLMRLGKGQNAMSYAQLAEETDPNNPRVHYIVGNCMLQARQFHLAYFELQNAVKLNPALAEAWEPLSRAAIAMGSGDEAYRAALMAEKIDKSPRAKTAVPRVLIWAGQYDKAETLLKESLKKDEKNPEILALLSFAEKQLGEGAQAEFHKKAAEELDKDAFAKADLPPAKP
ncbi:MAG: hypothetical protein K2Y22_02575 [Candidatus Obscuribacterales bacterium]|nr:hypothetical protein [Candidatus Obscuribacterales bacterium]